MAVTAKRWVSRLVVLSLGLPFAQPVAAGTQTSSGPVVIRDKEAGRHSITKIPSNIQRDTTVEPSIAVNPRNLLNAVTVYMQGRPDSGCSQGIGYSVTRDGGRTWDFGNMRGVTTATGGEYPSVKDPVVAFGPDKIVYAVAVVCTDETQNDVAISRSTDGGTSWARPRILTGPESLPLDDKPWIAVDHSDEPGHHLGRIYLVWDGVDPVVASYSDDRGDTWHGPFVVFAGAGIGAIPLVLPDGSLAVVFKANYVSEDADYQAIAVAPMAGSVPSGAPLAFGETAVIAEDFGGPAVRQQRAAGNVPTAAVDPETGRIYVAWTDTRFRTDSVQDVVLSSSDDGINWTEPARINGGATDNYVDHFAPWLVVGDDGSVRVAYRTQREAADLLEFRPYVHTWYQESTDGGETFTRRIRVNRNVRSDVRFAATAMSRAFFGEYNQIAAAGSWIYISRSEAFPLTRRERRRATFPPSVHHQRTWVAVIDRDGNGRP